jgi:hypothetical protein
LKHSDDATPPRSRQVLRSQKEERRSRPSMLTAYSPKYQKMRPVIVVFTRVRRDDGNSRIPHPGMTDRTRN